MNTEMIRACCRMAAMLAPLAVATHAMAGMSQDLASCTAAKGLSSAAACTRVMNSGRLPDEQFWIGHFNRGSGYRRANDYDKALADFDKAVELNSRFARAYQGRALVHDEQGEDYKAHADLDRAIELDPRDWSAYYSRATILRGARTSTARSPIWRRPPSARARSRRSRCCARSSSPRRASLPRRAPRSTR